MIRTLFFDFGNVIAHFDNWRAVRKLAKHTALPAAELHAILYDGPLEHAFECGTIDAKEYVREAIRRGGLKCKAIDFEIMFADIFTPNDDVIGLIPALKANYRLVLASNTNDIHFRNYCFEFADTLRHFSGRPTSHQAGARKPTAAFFEYCQQFAKAAPEECAFFDDIAANVEAGQRHGWLGIHYRPDVPFADQLRAAGIAFDH